MKARFYSSLLAALLLNGVTVSGAEITLFFSPRGGAQTAILQTIDTAQNQILVAAYSLTADPIAHALANAAARGVQVRILVDRRLPTAHHSKVPFLAQRLCAVRVDRRHHLMHQKVIIIDRRYLIAGSYNFTANAENRNAEILLLIDDTTAAAKAAANWHALYNAATLYQPTTQLTPPAGRARNRRYCPTCPPTHRRL